MNNEKQSKIDYGIILSVLLLGLMSVATIYSTTYLMDTGSLRATIMQVAWYIVGAVAVFVIMQFDSEQLWKLAPYAYAGGVLLLILVLLFYDRPTALRTGARSWFKIGPLTFQPSEVVKIAYILELARIVTMHNSHYTKHETQSDWLLLGKIVLLSAPMIGLVLMQNDLGTTLVYLAIMVGIILISGIQWKILLPIFLTGATFAVGLLVLVVYNRELLLQFGFKPYQFARIDSWIDPYHDASNASYQLMQAIKSIGSGQVFGKGFGVSEVYVPVRESDMIFTTIAENFGFLGGAFLIFLYFLLIYQMINVVFQTKNEFYSYIATGVIMMIAFHVLENIGMNIGLLPLTGIPLPFISQGGSSLLGNMMGIGLVMSMRYHYKSYMFSGDGEDFH
ncbi:FtsW/RodA/SpoVE family cell cycle protein [Lacticigenium naphthae]|uniref:FtsW/RodA/SpoVE family cell cycle protein n=1 Tax=Lacticigenium naphthae TaxID=515351 RepID=UPI00040B0BF0|nr:FtsW/RodA/SpoVE family cell cycle protein [Lacticigenium naphthae]